MNHLQTLRPVRRLIHRIVENPDGIPRSLNRTVLFAALEMEMSKQSVIEERHLFLAALRERGKLVRYQRFDPEIIRRQLLTGAGSIRPYSISSRARQVLSTAMSPDDIIEQLRGEPWAQGSRRN